VPKVTVLMPVYNGELFLREAIESILNQTFHDFEFLIIDDGSIDQSTAIIASYSDTRIRFFSNGLNHGLIFTLNKGLDLAQGEYIARMDCDDFAFPDRLARQVEFMNQYPDIGLCGTAMKYMNNDIWVKHPTDHEDIKAGLLFYCTLNHPTVMLRSSVVKSYSLYYDIDCPHTEDYELWTRMAQLTRITNIPDVLLNYRIHGEQIGAKHNAEQQVMGRKIVFNQLIGMGLLPTEDELNLHMDVCARRTQATEGFVQSVIVWFDKLRARNMETNHFSQQSLENVLASYFAEVSSFYHANQLIVKSVVKSRKVKSTRSKSRRRLGSKLSNKRGKKAIRSVSKKKIVKRQIAKGRSQLRNPRKKGILLKSKKHAG